MRSEDKRKAVEEARSLQDFWDLFRRQSAMHRMVLMLTASTSGARTELMSTLGSL